jgi:hypothetical protein
MDADSIKIGPVTIGEYEEVPSPVDFFEMLSGKEPTMEKVLVKSTEGDLVLKLTKELKIRKKFKFDDKDDGLGF